jgi:biotin carboxylase
MSRLIHFHGLGGPRPDTYVPRLSALAELFVVFDSRLEAPMDFIEAGLPEYAVAPADGPADAVRAAEALIGDRTLHGALTFSETMLEPWSALAESRGLRSHSLTSIQRTQNKLWQRRTLSAAGLPGPAHAAIEDEGDIEEALSEVGLPAVLKPQYGAGSALVFPIDSEETLRSSLARGLKLWAQADELGGHGELLRSHRPAFVLEHYMAGASWAWRQGLGDYVSVESMVYDGRSQHLAICDKMPLAWPFRETGDVMPSSLPGELRLSVLEMVTEAHAALELTDGLAHTEVKLTDKGPRIIEVNARIGGGVAENFALAAGYDIVTEAGKVALGVPPDPDVRFSRCVGSFLPQLGAGELPPSDEAFAQARQLRGVVAVRPGFPSEPWELGGGRIASVLIRGESLAEVLATRQIALDLLN